MWGVSQSRPVQDPFRAWMGVCSPCTGRGGPAPALQPFPFLSTLGSAPTSWGPGLGAAIAPAAASAGSGRVPSCRAAPLQELGPAPASGSTNRVVQVTAAPNPSRGAGGRLRVPPLGLQHPSDRGPGLGRAAARWLRSPPGEDPHSLPGVGDSGLGALGEAGNLNPVPPTHPGVKFPPTVFRVRKLRSRERSDYLQVTQEVRGVHSFNTYFEHSLWAGSSVGRGGVGGKRILVVSEREEHSCQREPLKA